MTTTAPSPTETAVQAARSRPVNHLTWITGIALGIPLLLVYGGFPTRNHYWDGIGFSLNIERASQNDRGVRSSYDGDVQEVQNIYFNPNHLLYNLVGYLIYKPLHGLSSRIRALEVLTAMSVFSSVAAALLVFLMLMRQSRDLRLSIWLTLLMAFSATWWKFSTDADAYVPCTFLLVLCAFLLSNSQRRPPAVIVGFLHALSMLLHQISIFFFPAVLVAIWFHPYWSGTRAKRKAVIAYLLSAGLPVAAAYSWVWFGVLNGRWSLHEFVTWVTFNGSDLYAFRSPSSNALESMRSSLRVFFGGRVSLALGLIEKPLLFVLAALMVASLVCLIMGFAKVLQERKRVVHELEHVEPEAPASSRFLITWTVTFFLFQFFWLTEFPYYRLFYLPALILLLGTALKRRLPAPAYRLANPVSAFVVFVMAFNFTFLIYPYAKVEATPPVKLALDANTIWQDNVLVFYKEFTCDNWMMRYFNPQTTWRHVSFRNRDDFARQVYEAFEHGRAVWVDTSVLGGVETDPDARRWLERYGRLSNTWGIVNQRHYIKFAQLLPNNTELVTQSDVPSFSGSALLPPNRQASER